MDRETPPEEVLGHVGPKRFESVTDPNSVKTEPVRKDPIIDPIKVDTHQPTDLRAYVTRPRTEILDLDRQDFNNNSLKGGRKIHRGR